MRNKQEKKVIEQLGEQYEVLTFFFSSSTNFTFFKKGAHIELDITNRDNVEDRYYKQRIKTFRRKLSKIQHERVGMIKITTSDRSLLMVVEDNYKYSY